MRALIRFLLAVALTAAAAAAHAQAVVTEVRGSATMQIGTANATTIVAGQKVPPGALLQTGAGSMVVLGFPDRQIVVLGEFAVFRIVDYRFDPAQPGAGQVHLNLVSGSLRLAVGDIGAANPGAIRVQIGVATMGVLPSESRRTDASAVVVNGPLSVVVQEGRAVVIMPNGQSQGIDSGQGAVVGVDGNMRQGTVAQMAELAGNSPTGREMVRQLAALQGATPAMQQTVIVLATVFGPGAEEEPLAAPATNTSTTSGAAGLGGGGGGNIASPN